MSNLATRAIEEIGKVIIGKDHIIRQVMTAILANGHILIEDIPGVGKTTLAIAFSKVLGLDYQRIQFTPDVMPADIAGFSVYKQGSESFEYQKGICPRWQHISCSLCALPPSLSMSVHTGQALPEFQASYFPDPVLLPFLLL